MDRGVRLAPKMRRLDCKSSYKKACARHSESWRTASGTLKQSSGSRSVGFLSLGDRSIPN